MNQALQEQVKFRLLRSLVFAALVLNKYKLWPFMEATQQAMQDEPRKAFKKMFKVFKGEKCIKKGVTIRGKNMDEYMPQFINFFKENLLQ